MTNLNEYLTAGRQALNRWRPQTDAALSTAGKTGSAEEKSKVEVPGLAEVLRGALDLPEYSVLLGVGEDRLPFHMDLTNPASGAVLICGDIAATGDAGDSTTGGPAALLRSILASAIALNSPQQLHLSVLTKHTDQYLSFSRADHCQEILPPDDEIVGELVAELAEIVEARRGGKKSEPAMLLFIDDLAECTRYLGERAYAQLYRLIRHGPRYRVWTFATLHAGDADTVEERFLSAFRTRLIGRIKDNHITAALSQDTTLRAGNLPISQFYLPYGERWMKFWACPVDAETAPSETDIRPGEFESE